jgi:hypothetical protein
LGKYTISCSLLRSEREWSCRTCCCSETLEI